MERRQLHEAAAQRARRLGVLRLRDQWRQQALYKAAPTRQKADALLDSRENAPFTADATDTWASSVDYDPSSGLQKIQAAVLAINSADDEGNAPETASWIARSSACDYYLIPASPETAGHGTTANAKWYAQKLGQFTIGPARN